MALTLGGSTNLASGTGTRNWSSPSTASKAYGVVVICGGSVEETTGVTWGGAAMTRVATGANTGGETGTASVWFIAQPGTGAQTVEITRSGSSAYIATAFDGTTTSGNAEVLSGGINVGYDEGSSLSISSISTSLTIPSGTVVALYGGLYSGENALSSITDNAALTRDHSQDFGIYVSVINHKTTTYTGTGSAYTSFAWTQSSDDAGWAVIAVKEAAPAAQTIALPLVSSTGPALYAPTLLNTLQVITLPLLEQVAGGTVLEDNFNNRTTSSPSWGTASTTGGDWTAFNSNGDYAGYASGFTGLDGCGTSMSDGALWHYGGTAHGTDMEATGWMALTSNFGNSAYAYGYIGFRGLYGGGYRIAFYGNTGGTVTAINAERWTGSYWQSVAQSMVDMPSTSGWNVRARVEGSSIKVRWWTGTEPSTWHIDTTDTNITTSGYPALGGYGDPGLNEGAYATFDDWTFTLLGTSAAPALYAPTLVQGDPPSTPTITVPFLESTPALYAPTVLPQPVGVTLGLLESTPALYGPTLTPKNTIVLGLLDAVRELYGPTLTPKNLISLGLLDAGSALYQPTLTPKNTLSLELLESTPALYAPTLAAGPVAVTVPLLDAGPELYAPTVTRLGGVQDISLELLESTPALYAPSLAPKNTLTVPLLDAGASLYAPTLLPKNTLTPPLLDAGPALYAPTIIRDQFVTVPFLDAGPALYAPTLAPQPVGITVPLLESTPALYAPTLAVGPVTIVLGLLDAGPDLYAPAVVALGASQTIALELLDAAAALYAPTLVQDRFVTLPFLDSGPALYAPTVAPAPRTVVLDLIDGARALYAPTLELESAIVVPLLDAGPALYAPTVAAGAVGITLPVLDAAAALYAPELAQTLIQAVVLPILDGGADLYPPTVANAAAIITGYTRSSTGSVLPGCTVLVYRSSDDSYVGSTTSDPITGRYTVMVQPGVAYFLVAWSSAGVYGTTARDLEGV